MDRFEVEDLEHDGAEAVGEQVDAEPGVLLGEAPGETDEPVSIALDHRDQPPVLHGLEQPGQVQRAPQR